MKNFNIHWTISIVIIFIFGLLCAHKIILAGGSTVFAGKISMEIPMATCSNQYTCSACSMCGCGMWSQKVINPVFGMTSGSALYICPGASAVPFGGGGFAVGSTILGYGSSNQIMSIDGTANNIWSVQQ